MQAAVVIGLFVAALAYLSYRGIVDRCKMGCDGRLYSHAMSRKVKVGSTRDNVVVGLY